MQDRFMEWAKHKYTERQRMITLIPLGVFFVFIMPYLLVRTANIDKRFNITAFTVEPYSSIVGAALIIFGFVWAIWSICIGFVKGEGTPVPMMPTQKLVVTGPYNYCRNPMALGSICAYLGVVIFIGSWSALGLLMILIFALLAYIKAIEEKELSRRFGQDYLEYKKRVPFIVPRIKRKHT